MAKSVSKMGRPPTYSKALANKICNVIATHSLSIRDLSKKYEWMPTPSTIFEWRLKHDYFSEHYTRAKQIQVECKADELEAIADSQNEDFYENDKGVLVPNAVKVQRDKLRVDTKKWILAHLAPKVYGDHKRVEKLEGQNDLLRKELFELRQELDKKYKKSY